MVVTRPSGLLLDAMGTLIGLRQSVGESYAAIAQDFGLNIAPEAVSYTHLTLPTICSV